MRQEITLLQGKLDLKFNANTASSFLKFSLSMSTRTLLIKLLALKRSQERGFTLVLALGMGLMMTIVATTLIFRASRNEAIASTRIQTGDSVAIAEAGIARTLVEFAKPENAVLLSRNYDPLISGTNRNYLGGDGIPHTDDDDDTNSTIDEWTSFSPPATSPCPNAIPNPPGTPQINFSGNIGSDGQYQLLAYRYNNLKQTGTFLVRGTRVIAGQPVTSAYVSATVAVESKLPNFPGVLQALETVTGADEAINLAGRSIQGSNGNIYFDPLTSGNASLDGVAPPNATDRGDYLLAIDSTANNSGFIDRIGTIVACKNIAPTLSNQIPTGATVTNLNGLSSSITISGSSSGISHYKADWIFLDDVTLDIDTKDGPVYLYVDSFVYLKGNTKIRNYRSDGKPAKVGDLRIILTSDDNPGNPIYIEENACIQTAFVYNLAGDVHLKTTSGSCDSGNSIDGVVWAEDFINDSNSIAGIAVPDDVSNLSDVINSLNLPTTYKLGSIQNWQRYKL